MCVEVRGIPQYDDLSMNEYSDQNFLEIPFKHIVHFGMKKSQTNYNISDWKKSEIISTKNDNESLFVKFIYIYIYIIFIHDRLFRTLTPSHQLHNQPTHIIIKRHYPLVEPIVSSIFFYTIVKQKYNKI